jgi:hypothetical protein
MTTMADKLMGETHKGATRERQLIGDAFKIVDTVKEQAAAIRADQRLSKVGAQAMVVEVALGDPWKHLGKLRDQAKAIAADIEVTRGKMVPKGPGPNDVEMRTVLRSLSRADRLRLARNDDEFAVAALTAHPVLSGLSDTPAAPGQPSDLDLVRTAYQQRNFIELFAGLELREEAMAAVEQALEIAGKWICDEAGIVEAEVDRLIAKADTTEVDPDDLPKITRADLKAWSATDPGRATAEMKKVFGGKAQLVD